MNTNHAKKRMQQRGISSQVVDWLIAYGNEKLDGRNCSIIYLKKRNMVELDYEERKKIERKLSSYVNVYLVMKDGVVITAAHHYKKSKHLN